MASVNSKNKMIYCCQLKILSKMLLQTQTRYMNSRNVYIKYFNCIQSCWVTCFKYGSTCEKTYFKIPLCYKNNDSVWISLIEVCYKSFFFLTSLKPPAI